MIETRGLRKTYRSREGRQTKTVDAVRGVDLDVAAGEIFGFLGPNGAGKTTTLRMLATLIEPDGGQATVAGADLRKADLSYANFGRAITTGTLFAGAMLKDSILPSQNG